MTQSAQLENKQVNCDGMKRIASFPLQRHIVIFIYIHGMYFELAGSLKVYIVRASYSFIVHFSVCLYDDINLDSDND